nr:MAG: nonstructural protein [Myna chaphamaparvovirus]
MERAGCSFRRFLWMGSPGTGGDISTDQAKAFLIPKDHVLSTYPECEHTMNLINMKQFVCGVFQICGDKGEPLTSPIPYSILFNNIPIMDQWAICGEYNKYDIFHVHGIFKTNARVDSVRRSMQSAWTSLNLHHSFRTIVGTTTASLDICKFQNCKKPSALFTYMNKDPEWVCSNTEMYLQMSYDIEHYDLAKRFREKLEEQPSTENMNQITAEITDLIVTHSCKNIEDCMRFGPEIMAKYLHRPGLKQIVENCFQFVKSTGARWKLEMFNHYDPDPSEIHKCLLHQGIVPGTFDYIFHDWLMKLDSKRNTLCLYGPSNTGKSGFIAGLKQTVPWGEIVNGSSGFNFEGLIDQYMAVWEEPLISFELAEKCKQIFEGMTTSIAVKYKKPHMLPRTPVILTTNHYPWKYCTAEEPTFRNRMWIFEFKYQCKDMIFDCRAVEYGCECNYCKRSRGCEDGSSSPSLSGMSPRTQSLYCTESPRFDETSNVGTGSMCTTIRGDGSSQSSSSDSLSTNTTESSIRSSSANVGNVRRIRLTGRNNNECGTSRSTKQCLESNLNRGSDGSNSSGNGHRSSRKRSIRRGDGETISEPSCSYYVGPTSSHTQTQALSTEAKRRKVSEYMATRAVKIRNTMHVPLKQDWQNYLSYLYHWYG